MRLRATSAPSSKLIPATTMSAAVVTACRPTTAARTNSERPLSSSTRVCRPTRNILMRATMANPNAPTSQATLPPTVSSAYVGPFIATNAGLSPTMSAAEDNSSCVV